MTRLLPALLLIFVLAGAALSDTLAERSATTFDDMKTEFANPPQDFAPFVFWFWDEPLDAAKLAEMAATMAEKGLNPGYAHPRTTAPGVTEQNPLPTDQWLSPLWFDAFQDALEASRQQGASLGYCDEYMWPSFSAAGRVLTEHPELRASSLGWQTFDLEPGQETNLPVCAFAVAAQLASPPSSRPKAEPRRGAWIWQPAPGQGAHTCYFRKRFDLPATSNLVEARLRLTCDNRYTAYINGEEVAHNSDWRDVRTFEIAAQLRPGANLIAIEGGGDGGLDALSVGLEVRLDEGEVFTVLSDATWQVASTLLPGWNQLSFDDSAWTTARLVESNASGGPWALNESLVPHVPAPIIGSTLRLVGEGEGLVFRAPEDTAWRIWAFHELPQGTVNYLDRRLAPAFIEIAHLPYAQRFGKELGHSIPGVFVDNEGSYGWRLAWSDDLANHFEEKFGQELRLALPLLLDEDVEGHSPVARWRWFDAVSDLYAETMGAPSDWLAERGAYCIENLWEESLQWQAQYVGDFFKLSRAYTMPGNDCLGTKALEVHDFKEVSSVAEFEGRRLMSEIMGAGGWGPYNPTFIKQATNSVIAWGVGHIVPHGVFTNRNLVGNVWTPDWYNENPFWPWLDQWADFSRRASYINSHGRLVPDVLLLNPMDSVWALAPTAVFDPTTTGDLFETDKWFGPRVSRINQVYSEAINTLTANRVEFLITDRYYLRTLTTQEGTLIRDDFTFRAVVLPELAVLPRDIAQLLVNFAASGGQVYALGNLPEGSVEGGWQDGEFTELMKELAAQPTFHQTDNLAEAIASGVPELAPQVTFKEGEFDLLVRHIRHDGRDLFWLVNNAASWRQVRLHFRARKGAASKWDCETGAIIPLGSTEDPNGAEVALTFRPYEAFWLAFDSAETEQLEQSPPRLAESLLTLAGPWTVQYDPADQPELQFPSPPPADFTTGVVKPLASWPAWGLEWFSGRLDYLTGFDLALLPEGPVTLDLGLVFFSAEVWLNGHPASARLWPPHRFDVTGLLREGRNLLQVKVANLVNNSYGEPREGGLLGPVRLLGGPLDAFPGAPPVPPKGNPVALQNATADHSQPGFTVAGLLDGDPKTGWGGWDATLREPIAAIAVVETAVDVGKAGQSTTLVFILEQTYEPPEGLLLGRFRISATTADRATFADGKLDGGAIEAPWTVLFPDAAWTSGQSVLLPQPDGSVLAVGPYGRDTYTVVCHTDLTGITGFRLEALEDASLPKTPQGKTEGGPGRTPGEGNFTVTRLAVTANVE